MLYSTTCTLSKYLRQNNNFRATCYPILLDSLSRRQEEKENLQRKRKERKKRETNRVRNTQLQEQLGKLRQLPWSYLKQKLNDPGIMPSAIAPSSPALFYLRTEKARWPRYHAIDHSPILFTGALFYQHSNWKGSHTLGQWRRLRTGLLNKIFTVSIRGTDANHNNRLYPPEIIQRAMFGSPQIPLLNPTPQ